jgi:hypothetical protein
MAVGGLADMMAAGANLGTGAVGGVMDALGPLVGAAGKLLGPIGSADNMIEAGMKMDRDTDLKDKIVDGIHMGTALVGTGLNLVAPGLGSAVETVANAVTDTASYLTDLSTGQADPIPKAADVHGRDPIANAANTITSSKAVNTFIRNWGSGTGGFF